MILTDIYIPSIDEVFDFELDEQVQVKQVVRELVEMIAKRTKSTSIGSESDFWLYDMTRKTALREDAVLSACGVANGDRLMLI